MLYLRRHWGKTKKDYHRGKFINRMERKENTQRVFLANRPAGVEESRELCV